jgi:hypothetical protein
MSDASWHPAQREAFAHDVDLRDALIPVTLRRTGRKASAIALPHFAGSGTHPLAHQTGGFGSLTDACFWPLTSVERRSARLLQWKSVI